MYATAPASGNNNCMHYNIDSKKDTIFREFKAQLEQKITKLQMLLMREPPATKSNGLKPTNPSLMVSDVSGIENLKS